MTFRNGILLWISYAYSKGDLTCMEQEYTELRQGKMELVIGVFEVLLSALVIGACLINPREYLVIIVIVVVCLFYSIFRCLNQINWYIRYNSEGFEVQSFTRKKYKHSYDEVECVKELRKGAAIIYMKNSHRQYHIEPKVEGSEIFLSALYDYNHANSI